LDREKEGENRGDNVGEVEVGEAEEVVGVVEEKARSD